MRIQAIPQGDVRAQFVRLGVHEGERVRCIERLPGGTIVLGKHPFCLAPRLKELAQAVGQSSHGYISELEGGRKVPTAEFVLEVARLFGVTTDSLLRDDVTLTVSEERPSD